MSVIKKIKVEFVSINIKGTKEEWASVDVAEFDYPADALAFHDGLPKDRRITDREDISNHVDIPTSNVDSSIYEFEEGVT